MQAMPAGNQLAEAMGARRVDPATVPLIAHPVEQIATNAKIPTPSLFLLPIDEPNACVWGFSPYDSALVVTEPLVQLLGPTELRAVLAHEVGHIVNRSVAEQTQLAAKAAGIAVTIAAAEVAAGIAAFVSQTLLDDFLFFVGAAVVNRSVRASAERRFRVWHHRHEFAADGYAAQLELAPWLASALFKLDRAPKSEDDNLPTWSRVAQFAPKISADATHPATYDRVRALPGPFGPLINQPRCPGCATRLDRSLASCPTCGIEVSEECGNCRSTSAIDDRYCTACGERKPARCPACGKAHQRPAPYCLSCGFVLP